MDLGEGCRGCAPLPPPKMTCGFLIQLVFCEKKTTWFIGVEVEQEMSALPPTKNPGSTPYTLHMHFLQRTKYNILQNVKNMDFSSLAILSEGINLLWGIYAFGQHSKRHLIRTDLHLNLYFQMLKFEPRIKLNHNKYMGIAGSRLWDPDAGSLK